jgi:hypothetical protein
MMTADEGPSFFARYIDAPATAPRRRQENPEDRIAGTILRALRQNRPDGLNKLAIFNLFYRNQSAAKLDAALDKLWQEGKVRYERHPTGRRPAQVWFATQHD